MKKFIFLKKKSMQEYWHTFSCVLKTGFPIFFRPNSLGNAIFIYGTLLLFGLMPNSYGQLVGGAAVKANFGVEADAYANLLQFGNFDGPANTDDWFNETYIGNGKGVIDESSAAANRAAIMANSNFTFELRQSITTPTFPFPYPVVDGNGVPYLWLDAVYGRDTNSAQGTKDSSIFTSTSDKNSDNPITWNLGTGDIPQKDDIIDVMAHLRGTNPHDPKNNPGFPVDDRPFDELWAYAAATLRSTDGSKHIDFEFFRTLVTYSAGGSQFGNTGNDGGRTAWVFDALGNVITPGTIVISVDYENGGTNPNVRIRLWMDESVFNGLNASAMAELKFAPVPGSFEKGEQSGNFGYGRITTKVGSDTNIFGRVNAEDTTLGPPWGTLQGEKATFFDSYQKFQHVEIGINLTAFGLDRKGTTDPCANILGSLLVKTRSSAGGQSDSFTSELKDFAGPFQFGFTVTPEVSLAVNREINCINENATITASGIMPPGSIVEFYGPDPTPDDKTDGIGPLIPAEEAAPDLNRLVTQGGVYAALVSATGFTGCTATDYVTVVEDKTPPSCVISGTDDNFCPLSTGHNYSGPDGLSSYAWSIVSGNATIVGSTEIQSVSVTAGSPCGEFVLQLITTGVNGCTSTCTKTLTISDIDKPIIATTAVSGDLGCNATFEVPVFTLTEACSPGDIVIVDGGAIADGCNYSQTWTANFTDACQNAADEVSVTYTWTVDTDKPIITCSPDKTIDCDAEIVFDTPTATDNCSGVLEIVVVSTSTDGLTRTWKATDACGNEATCSQTITVLPCEGCTLGYWKNHTDRWCSTYSTTMLFGDVFEEAPSNLKRLTLLEALNLGGGGIFNLARQGVAALLNTCSDEVRYPEPYGSNSQMVIDAVNSAYVAGGNAPGKLATQLDILNNTGCPLGGTSANPKGGQSNDGPGVGNGKNNTNKEVAGFTAYPVPFKDILKVKYDFDYVSNVKIEVFNPQGEVVLSKMDENSYLNKEVNLHVHSYRGQEQVYLVKLTTDRGSSIKKVMSSK
jgi:hypothetical protein